MWAPDGHRLICRRTDQLWVLDLQTDAGFPAGEPRLLLERPVFATTAVVRNWDLSPDGRRFSTEKNQERKPQPVTEMMLVQNCLEELKRLVPAEKN